jgi:hypothetical protein
MENVPPRSQKDEPALSKSPFACTPARPEEELHSSSRINFARVYTIEHNMKVLNVGKIVQAHLRRLETYFLQTMSSNRREELPAIESTITTYGGKEKNAQASDEENGHTNEGSLVDNDATSGLDREMARLTTS